MLSVELMQINWKIPYLHFLLSKKSIAFSMRLFGLQVYVSYPVKKWELDPDLTLFKYHLEIVKYSQNLEKRYGEHSTDCLPVVELHVIWYLFNCIIPLDGVLRFQGLWRCLYVRRHNPERAPFHTDQLSWPVRDLTVEKFTSTRILLPLECIPERFKTWLFSSSRIIGRI